MIRLVASLLLLAAVSASAQERIGVVVTFKEQATVDGADIRLKDIAEVKASDAVLTARLESLRVGTLPSDGLRRIVQRGQVIEAIKKAERGVAVTAEGTAHTTVELRTNHYSAAVLIDTVREHLTQTLKQDYPSLTRVEITPVGEFPELRVPSGKIAVAPRTLPNRRLAQRVSVWLDVQVDGKPYRTLPVWVNVEAYAPVLVTQRSLAPRERIFSKDVVREERNVAGLSGNALAEYQEIASRRVRTHVPAGKVLKAADVEPSPVVLTDQEVNVRVAAGSVVIETKAVAEQEGHVGEYIRIRNPSSAAIFVAQVVGNGSVQVTER